MKTQWLDMLPLWGLLLGGWAVLWLALEGGYRFGRWRHDHRPDEREQPVGAIVASILGLLALVLGFTFSLAASRFDAKRVTLLEEANAIGTTFLRARLLPEPQAAEMTRLLREYVEVRIEGAHPDRVDTAIQRSEELHELLWVQTQAMAQQDARPILTGLFVQSLNEMIDLHAKRVMVGLYSRIPPVLWAGLFGLSLVGMASVGYQSGLSATRRSPAMLGMVVAFSFVMFLIADLDRSQEGLLRVSQQALVDVQRSMQTSSP